jgi:MoaA/NifB/PqqE/SkfB family radical SAM enzyme
MERDHQWRRLRQPESRRLDRRPRPFNINISIDSREPGIHNYSRGIDGSLDDILAGIQALCRAKARHSVDFPIIVKAVVHRLSFRKLPDMVDWVRDIGATTINFQPVERVIDESKDEFWIDRDELDDLIAVKNRLIAMKRAGAPILNSELLLDLWPNHFRREKAPREALPCRIGMRNFFIRADGRVEVCWNFPPIGNVPRRRGKSGTARRAASAVRKPWVARPCPCSPACRKSAYQTNSNGPKAPGRPQIASAASCVPAKLKANCGRGTRWELAFLPRRWLIFAVLADRVPG